MYFTLGPGVSLQDYGPVSHSGSNDIMTLLAVIPMADPAYCPAESAWVASLEFFLDRKLVQS